jgi:hypothetical protein
VRRHALLAEFVAKAPFIDGSEQAGAEAAVSAHGQADDPVREVSVVTRVLIYRGQARFKQLDDAITGLGNCSPLWRGEQLPGVPRRLREPPAVMSTDAPGA